MAPYLSNETIAMLGYLGSLWRGDDRFSATLPCTVTGRFGVTESTCAETPAVGAACACCLSSRVTADVVLEVLFWSAVASRLLARSIARPTPPVVAADSAALVPYSIATWAQAVAEANISRAVRATMIFVMAQPLQVGSCSFSNSKTVHWL
jgi:hypothetical protein